MKASQVRSKKARWLWTGGITSLLLTAGTLGGSWGVAYGQTAPSSTTTTSSPSGTISATSLTAPAPVTTTATVSTATGATVIAGNVGASFAPGFTSVANANVTITPTLPAGPNLAGLAGNVSASPNGTNFELSVTDASTGAQVTSFDAAITFTVLPNAADLAMASGNSNILNVVYFTVPNTISVFNPLGLPPNTPIFQPGVTHNTDGTLSWANQNGAGVVQAVVANPISYVQTLSSNAAEYSSFDPSASTSFGTKPQFSYLQVTEPQIPGVNRLVVLDPDTGNYSYVNATDVAPSGPPPAKASGAVVRGLINH